MLNTRAGLSPSAEHPRFCQPARLSLPSSLDCPSLILSLTVGGSRRLTKRPDWSYRLVCVRGKWQIILETMSLFRELAPGRNNQPSRGGSAWQQLCLIQPKSGQICGLLSCAVTRDAAVACWSSCGLPWLWRRLGGKGRRCVCTGRHICAGRSAWEGWVVLCSEGSPRGGC